MNDEIPRKILDEPWLDNSEESFWYWDLHVHVVEDEKPIARLLDGLLKNLLVGSSTIIDHDEDDALVANALTTWDDTIYNGANVLITDVNNGNPPDGLEETITRVRKFLQAGKPVLIISGAWSNEDILLEEFDEEFASWRCFFMKKPLDFKRFMLIMKWMQPQVKCLSAEVKEALEKKLNCW